MLGRPLKCGLGLGLKVGTDVVVAFHNEYVPLSHLVVVLPFLSLSVGRPDRRLNKLPGTGRGVLLSYHPSKVLSPIVRWPRHLFYLRVNPDGATPNDHHREITASFFCWLFTSPCMLIVRTCVAKYIDMISLCSTYLRGLWPQKCCPVHGCGISPPDLDLVNKHINAACNISSHSFFYAHSFSTRPLHFPCVVCLCCPALHPCPARRGGQHQGNADRELRPGLGAPWTVASMMQRSLYELV